MTLRAVIFDCDGVLADTEPLHLQAFNAVLAPLGITLTPADYAASYLGLDDRDAFALALERAGLTTVRVDDLVATKARCFRPLLAAGVRIYAGVVPLVRSLAPLALGVASGARREEIAIVLAHAGLTGAFEVIVAAEDVVAGKPHPEPYLTALAGLNRAGRAIAPAECVVVEDSRVGILAARTAGMRCLAISNSYDAPALGEADRVVASLAEVGRSDLERLTTLSR